ncbi:MAG: Gfo/Idh/MocA family oxidoreductase [Bacteroidota bacterium]
MAGTDTSKRPILIAGLGSIGRRHLRNLVALGGPPPLLYRTGKGQAGDLNHDVPTVHDLGDALAQRPQAVVVSNPTALHVETALAAAKAGCHLLLEKPISHTRDGLDALRSAVEARRLTVLVGFQFRFYPTLAQVQTWLHDGAIGRLVSAQVHWGEYLPGWHPAEDHRLGYSARADLGGGVIHTLSHPLDYLRMLLGDVDGGGEVVRVSAMTTQQGGLGIEVEDVACLTLGLANGAMVQVYLDYVQRPPSHTLRIVGSAGRIDWDNATAIARLYRATTGTWAEALPPDGFERNDLFREEMRHFLACLDGSESPRCTLEDGVRALDIALAAYESAAAGRMVTLA